jgi:hypothetical protein
VCLLYEDVRSTWNQSHVNDKCTRNLVSQKRKEKKRKKKKRTPVDRYRHEYKPVDRALIAVFCDAVYSVMPPLVSQKKHNC